MTAASSNPSTPAPVLAKPKAARLPMLALAASGLTLSAALVAGPTDSALAFTLAIGAVWLVLLVELGRRAVAGFQSGAWLLFAASGFGLVVVALISAVAGRLTHFALGWAVFFAITGLLFVIAGIASRLGGRESTPWQRLAGREGTSQRSDRLRGILPLLLGTALLLFAVLLTVVGVEEIRSTYPNRATLVVALGAIAVLATIVFGALNAARLRTLLTSVAVPSGPRADDDLAAHLHDSVLQTLALIGRSAEDPAAVRRLARSQERELRDWLSGRDGARAGSLAAAMREIAADVEAEHDDAQVDVVTVGDVEIDARIEVLLRAAEEALRNACRHGEPPQHVYAEVSGEGSIEVYVRDAGSGFEPERLPPGRRGVRDAIIGRMQHVGGSAEIESGEDGTEVALRLPLLSDGDGIDGDTFPSA